MLYQPDVFFYLWLLPVTFLVLAPAALSTCRFTIGCLRTAQAAEESAYVDEAAVAEA